MKSLTGKKVRIALAGGGTGGHVYPLIAVAEALQAEAQTAGIILELHYYGARDRFRKDIEARGIKFHSLLTGKLRRYPSLLNFIDIPKAFLGVIQALFKMYVLMPDVVFSKGGPGAFQVAIAGWFYKIPLVIHESDAMPGLATLATARFAKKIALSFEEALPYFNPAKTLLVGNPVRPTLLATRPSQADAKARLGFDASKPLLFVTGGSQGARKLNEFVLLNLASILPVAQILHQTGPDNFVEVKKLAEAELVNLPTELSTQSRYLPLAYLDPEQARNAQAAADIILGRAGSGTIFEAAAFGKPMILVPLGSAARDHQRANAQAFAQKGACLIIEEANLSSNIFMSELKRMLENPNALQVMSQASAAFGKPRAAADLAKVILELV